MDRFLLEFLNTGKIAFLELGMPVWEVKKYFPKMYEDNLCSQTNTLKAFCFKSLVLWFYKKDLMSIEIDFSGASIQLPTEIMGDEKPLIYPKSIEEFTDCLNSSDIGFEKKYLETYVFEDNQERLLPPDKGYIELKINDRDYAKFSNGKLLNIGTLIIKR
jgi:hypothetical protein